MSKTSKYLRLYKYGFTGSKKKFGINYWRFFFNAIEASTAVEKMFYIELEMMNPWISPNETVLGFKPRIKITENDLQYALAGTASATGLETETIVQPSYCALRVGVLGQEAKQLCAYFPVKELQIKNKPFEIIIGNKIFTEDKTSGFLNVSEDDLHEYPEYMCDKGFVKWNISYETQVNTVKGYKSKYLRWFPFGLQTYFSGNISFNGNEYILDPKRSYGYIDRFWGKTFPETWFHISSSNLSSIINGKPLFNSSFVVQGTFEDKVSFIGNIEGSNISFCADDRKQYNVIWECSQMPEGDNPEENQLHWSVSIHNKLWVLDIDLYCFIKELNNRSIELPDGNRRVLNILEGGNGTGEIKLYKRVSGTLEQIENAKIQKAVCEFGHNENVTE